MSMFYTQYTHYTDYTHNTHIVYSQCPFITISGHRNNSRKVVGGKVAKSDEVSRL